MAILYHCFGCGQPGHLKSECPAPRQRKHPPPPPGGGAVIRFPPQFTAPHTAPVPPNDAYKAAKAERGWTGDGSVLTVECPWCRAGRYRCCVNRGVKTPKTNSHGARAEAYRDQLAR